MIPLQLTLRNFLSYQEATLDFRGFHTACICGANGAGKSSLLEAITWALWGESRAATEEDVMHTGSDFVRVDFQFICNEQTYRVIRTRQRGKNSGLDFQVENGDKFRSLSGKGLRDTQEQVITCLKLDYDTFINSAYLRQGRADEFMQRRPNERKQILADLLKLEQYEQLAEQAKDLSKQLKGQAEQLENSLAPLEQQLLQKETITAQLLSLESEILQLQEQQEQDRESLQKLQVQEHQRQTWEQQLNWKQNQYQSINQECDRLFKEQSSLKHQLAELETTLQKSSETIAQYQHLINLEEQEKTLLEKFQIFQEVQQQKQQLEQQLVQQSNELNLQIQKAQTRLEALQQQEQENQQILSQEPEVKKALERLRQLRQRINELEKLHSKVSPLLQRRQALETEIDRKKAQIMAKLDRLKLTKEELEEELGRFPQIRQAAITVDTQIQELDKKKNYQKRILEKRTDKKEAQQRLQEQQKLYEKQLEELNQKLDLLSIPDANCPLCEQELDHDHRHQVIRKTQNQQQDLQETIWELKEQVTRCLRDLQNLQKEENTLTQEIEPYNELQQYFAQLEAQLEARNETNNKLKKNNTEIEQVEQDLFSKNYAQDLQVDLQFLNQELVNLKYDEQTHALLKGEEKNWKWAEIKQSRIEDAHRRQMTINAEKPQIVKQINDLQEAMQQLQISSEIKRKIQQIEQKIQDLGYDRTQLQTISNAVRQAKNWQMRYHELRQAERKYPELQNKHQELEQILQQRRSEQEKTQQELEQLRQQITNLKDYREEIQTLNQTIQNRRRQLDEGLGNKGRLEAASTQLETLQSQQIETKNKLKEIKKKYRIYQELSQAFGKNGIQALMIENVLPQLEAETNHILARLTGNQLHVQFLTQRAGKRKNSKLIDTLEIVIADTKGRRPYETYSGGEAFRINFSIRLALAKLLAQRAGTALQLLIIDEGFGTQDAEGCDRLIAAINAIANDFSCILTVTHMPQFKEAFQNRIEVQKTNQGSKLILSN